MTGVEELRARIEALSAKIVVQRESLRRLEHDRSSLQGQLNAVLDPLARLPLEISSDIFLRTLPSTPQPPNVHNVPMLLLDVCKAWNHIALSTPAFWANICVVYPCPASFEAGLQTWLERAGTRPLSVSLRGKFCGDGAATLIWSHAERFRHLEICDEQEEDVNSGPGEGLINLIGVECPDSMPLLETLTICGSGLDQAEFSGQQILDLLDVAPNLVECTFRDMYPVGEPEIGKTAPKLVLPALRRIDAGDGSSDAPILKYITLPALQALRLSMVNFSFRDLHLLVQRSSPPLEELILDRTQHSILVESLHLLPTLRYLEMRSMQSDLLRNLLAALTDSPSMLPDLHTLSISRLRSAADDIDVGSVWMALLHALSCRPKLQAVHVALMPFQFDPSLVPNADMLTAFRGLAKSGVQISISSDANGQNFLKDLIKEDDVENVA
ncbi:hypothetical protein C8R47DRAFT_1025109 [Mycena vitilis]|nr:hypothetical protein C8R47DRAFT_1025109 [Mycena vitilis]